MQNYDLTFFVMLNVVKNLLFSFEYKRGDPSLLSSLKGDNKKSFPPSQLSFPNAPSLSFPNVSPLLFPSVSIGNPSHLSFSTHFVIPECIYRESTAFTREWIPVFTGMTKKGTGMTVKLSFPT